MYSNQLAQQFSQVLTMLANELAEQLASTEAELIQVKKLMDDAIDDLVDGFISLEATTRIGQNMLRQMVSDTPDGSDEHNPFREKQMQSTELLLETASVLEKLVQDAKTHHIECEKLADTDKFEGLKRLQNASKKISTEAKEVESKVISIIRENVDSLGMVAGELSTINSQVEQDVQTAVKSLQFQDMTTQLIVQCAERQKIMRSALDAIKPLCESSKDNLDENSLRIKLEKSQEALTQVSKMRMKAFNVDAGSVELF